MPLEAVDQEEACQSVSSSDQDAGWGDEIRGRYDIQGCGTCNDYCQWAEGDDSSGNPSEKTQGGPGGPYWSCMQAGRTERAIH